MTSWFNLIAANRIIHRNKLPKWCYWATEIFNNNGNHGHDVWLYYFITALGLCICWAVTKRTWCVAQHAVVGPEGQMALPRSKQACEDPQLASQIRVLMGVGVRVDIRTPLRDSRRLFVGSFCWGICWLLVLRHQKCQSIQNHQGDRVLNFSSVIHKLMKNAALLHYNARSEHFLLLRTRVILHDQERKHRGA